MKPWNVLAALSLLACGQPMTMDDGGTGGGSGGSAGGGSVGGGSGGAGGSAGGSSTGGGGGSAGGTTSAPDAGRFFQFAGLVEQVPVPANESCDLEVDSAGRLHVVTNHTFVDDGGVDYSVRETDGGWTTERIAHSVGIQSVGSGAKIALDSAGRPVIAYTHADLQGVGARTRLFVASKPAGSWTTQEIEDAGIQVSVLFGFELDPTDRAHLAYRVRNAANPDGGPGTFYAVRYATSPMASGMPWLLLGVHTQPASGPEYATSLAVDSTQTAHVFYRSEILPDGGNGGVGLAYHASRNAAGQFDYESMSNGAFTRAWATAAPGSLHVADNTVLRRKIADGGWDYGPGSSTGNSVVLKTAPNGAVWNFSNFSAGNGGGLNVGRWFNGAHQETVDAGVGGVAYSGWGFDSAGRPWGAVYRTNLGVFVVRLD